MTDLSELIERVEAATGPDRELDIAIALNLPSASYGERIGKFFNAGPRYEGAQDRIGFRADDDGSESVPGNGPDMLVRNYTASLDAAMTLVPEHYRLASLTEEPFDDEVRPWAVTLTLRVGRFGKIGVYGRGASAALALVDAALRSIQEGVAGHDRGGIRVRRLSSAVPRSEGAEGSRLPDSEEGGSSS